MGKKVPVSVIINDERHIIGEAELEEDGFMRAKMNDVDGTIIEGNLGPRLGSICYQFLTDDEAAGGQFTLSNEIWEMARMTVPARTRRIVAAHTTGSE